MAVKKDHFNGAILNSSMVKAGEHYSDPRLMKQAEFRQFSVHVFKKPRWSDVTEYKPKKNPLDPDEKPVIDGRKNALLGL